MARILRSLLCAALLLAFGACGAEGDERGRPAEDAGSGGSGGLADSGGWPDGAAGGAAGAATGGIGGTGAGGGSGGSGGSGGAADACPRAKVDVSAGSTLNVRPTPSTAQPAVGTLADGEIVQVLAQAQGESVNGNTLWFHIATPILSGYISSEFAACTQEKPPPPPAAYPLPE